MKVKIISTGEVVKLIKNVSLSGKTTTWHGDISLESWTALSGYPTIRKNRVPSICIDEDGRASVCNASPTGAQRNFIHRSIKKSQYEIIEQSQD